MIAEFLPCSLHGTIDAPPSKSVAHRYLIGAALSGQTCTLCGVDFSGGIRQESPSFPMGKEGRKSLVP